MKETQNGKSAQKKHGNIRQVLLFLSMAAVLIGAVYIMINGIGLIDSLDFGAGAYYYADIPAFQRFVNGEAYTSETPMWLLTLLFLAWGALMYRLWVWADKKWK